ncbi:MAG: hypothetical protein CFE23_05505 [Flavobacterium sp. BFFFF1]|uniref:DUF3667 domain-containing protein n=1 Tax=Flavobacterium sp. BFFFF1 TaxID=2015557 RepID=UPI000BC3C559|nr:DUF3667 domain-containing protein [Flavobacterium sp. BFFFF1]OYU81221.1 MAG: hypothetical protein CFE23_05505 [Flavobacterium sp. BFFFF1]
MSKNQLRSDKTCLNCNHVVHQRFCPNCGQENTDSRKTFHHLFIHFFEDLTHYENAFWKTIRNLLLKPASLSKEYLSGKRLSYLAPVRLYIFISFITFFVISIVAEGTELESKPLREIRPPAGLKLTPAEMAELREIEAVEIKQKKVDSLRVAGLFTKDEAESMKQSLEKNYKAVKIGEEFGYRTVRQLDSVQHSLPESKKFSPVKYWFYRKMTLINQKGMTGEELVNKFKESFLHNFPKVLFIYMPIFAFFLWLFHSKKRWYYFDHGIFTLHYFSFLLLVTLISISLDSVLTLLHSDIADLISQIMIFGVICWMLYYFFPAHHRFYGESRGVSFIKTAVLFFINFIIVFILLLSFMVYTLINLH